MKVSLIFDIGKTNKKCILFDKSLQIVYQTIKTFPEIKDEDGFPCDDLNAIVAWIKSTSNKLLKDQQYDISEINFSTYGASFVHLDKKGNVLMPLYNYLKPFPQKILKNFFIKYGKPNRFAKETGSPVEGMLNSGLQLYWLKKTKPKVFKKIKWSLHLPQYLSFIFSNKAYSEFTSIGCHTGLWNYQKQDYHRWIYQEKVHQKLAPIVSSDTFTKVNKVKIGTGVHDSSAAIFPYFQNTKKEFLLLSTGTWNVALNPFCKTQLRKRDLKKGCLNYMQIDGNAVRASRILLGKEHEWQVKQIAHFFKTDKQFFIKLRYDKKLVKKLKANFKSTIYFKYLDHDKFKKKKSQLSKFRSVEEAYHQLMLELVQLQAKHIRLIASNKNSNILYVEGGFTKNKIFLKLLKKELSNFKIKISDLKGGPALGAALLMKQTKDLKNYAISI